MGEYMEADVLICVSHLRWDFVWQQPQHLRSRFVQKRRVLFIEEPISSTETDRPHLEILSAPSGPNLTVLRLVQPVTELRWIGQADPLTQATYNSLLSQYLDKEAWKDALSYVPVSGLSSLTSWHSGDSVYAIETADS
jgi:hypothetical protein